MEADMTRKELREQYEKELGKKSWLNGCGEIDDYFTDEYVEWLEDQLCQPCKRCQILQKRINELLIDIKELKDHFKY
jgi:hypothetical protein